MEQQRILDTLQKSFELSSESSVNSSFAVPNSFQKTEIFDPFTKEFAYVIGVSYGDLYVGKRYAFNNNKTKKKYLFHTICLIVRDFEFIKRYKDCFERSFHIRTKIGKIHNKKYNKEYYIVSSYKRYIYDIIKKYQDIEFIKNLSDDLKIEVLRGIFDSEGSITYYNRFSQKKHHKELLIRIAQHHLKGRCNPEIEFLLNHFNIKNSRNHHSFNMWNRQAYKFYKLLGNITIKRKRTPLQKYKLSNLEYWTDNEVEKLIGLYYNYVPFKEMIIILNRSWGAINFKLCQLRKKGKIRKFFCLNCGKELQMRGKICSFKCNYKLNRETILKRAKDYHHAHKESVNSKRRELYKLNKALD